MLKRGKFFYLLLPYLNFLTMKNIFLSFLIILFIFFSCRRDSDVVVPSAPVIAYPVACFSVEKPVRHIDSSHVFVFTNCSQNAVRYEWDFGDTTYAPVANPIHTFNHVGKYIVRMTAYSSDDIASTMIDTIILGHYSFDKIVCTKTSTRFMIPFVVRIIRQGYFTVVDSISSLSILPITSLLPESYSNVIDSMNIYCYYREDSASVHIIKPFIISFPQFINQQLDVAVSCGVYDTAKFTMHYGIAPN